MLTCFKNKTRPKKNFKNRVFFYCFTLYTFSVACLTEKKHQKFHQLVYPAHRTTKLNSQETTFFQKPKSTKPKDAAKEEKATIIMYFKIKNTLVEILQFEKKEPQCILQHTRNDQTKEN